MDDSPRIKGNDFHWERDTTAAYFGLQSEREMATDYFELENELRRPRGPSMPGMTQPFPAINELHTTPKDELHFTPIAELPGIPPHNYMYENSRPELVENPLDKTATRIPGSWISEDGCALEQD